MSTLYHVTSVLNRASILTNGLDWTFMSAAPGIAGSHEPEARGVFLCRDDEEARYFVRLNNTGGPADVWAVEGVSRHDLVDNGSGYQYLPAQVHRSKVPIVEL